MSLEYRREIDGLRALAVLAVVAFHAHVPGFSGGFAGVDIFLVISGYLIGGLILREADAGTFSLVGFYERRVRRILPALLAMLAVSALAGWMLLPGDFRQFGASVSATALMLSNFLFERGSGYFSLNAAAPPLLHTWSLAVEEQFYLLFPALLLLVRQRGAAVTRIALAAVALLSLAYSIWAVRTDPAMAFYSPLSRAWEFLAGALLATGMIRTPARRDLGDAVALLGLALIGLSLWRLNPATPFPGLAALPIVLGTVLLLFGTRSEGSRMARLLGLRPLVAIGLISYSLYLWHWPLIVFGGYYALDDRTLAVTRIAMALLAFPVAWLSWRFVEQPFRKPRLLLSRRALFVSAAAVSLALAAYGAAIYRLNGVPGRFDPVVQHLSDRGGVPDYGCTSRPIEAVLADSRCRFGDPAVSPSFVLWGDSHAAVFEPMLKDLARRHGVSGYGITTFGCPPLFAVVPSGAAGERNAKLAECLARNEQTVRRLLETRPRAVLIAAHWGAYTGGKNRKHKVEGSVDEDPVAFEAGVRRLTARGIAVYLVLNVPQASTLSIDQLAKARVIGADSHMEPVTADHLRRTQAMRTLATDLHRKGLVEIVDPAALLCGPRLCRMTEGEYPLYYDSNHLNARGARFVGPLFEPILRRLARHGDPN